MNYRHAFHAGNFADVIKHVLLVRILVHLCRKPTSFRVVDTHAGIGRYDLGGPEAERTGEWQDGVGRLREPFEPAVEDLLAPYRKILADTADRYGASVYPGSPAIVREMLRPGDRAVLAEKHGDDGALLAERFGAVGTMKVLRMDGWTALGGLVPPKERRGLVLVDPPYEEPGEIGRAAELLAAAIRKWPTGIYALWYPIKDGREGEAPAAALAALRPSLRLELLVDRPSPAGRLAGSGLLVVNPPWTLDAEAGLIGPALAERLGRSGRGAFRSAALGER